MPNWCFNQATFSHKDTALVERISKAVDRGLFSEFFPIPASEKDNWYDWNCENWGTKWDVMNATYDMTEDKTQITLEFNTAWSAPIAFYQKMSELGFTIEALYNEPGMEFAGSWNDEGGEEHVEYDFSDPNWDEGMSEDLKDFLQPDFEYWLESQEEEEAEDAA